MTHIWRRMTCALMLLVSAAPVAGAQAPLKPVVATVTTTLQSEKGQIRQFALDGDPTTYFVSARNPTSADHFTLTFDKPVAVRSIVVATGRPGRGDGLDKGTLEASADGKTFRPLAAFADGAARAEPKGQKILAVRVQPAADLNHLLAIGEFTIDSDPPVAIFKYPIEFVVDVTDAPDMKDWAEKAARVCERNYAMISEELRSEGFKPRNVITMTLKKDYKGVAAAGGGRITGSVTYFQAHQDDIGAMVHETVHCVQDYRTRNNPSWLVEGIADYIRFFKYEPGKLGKIRANAHYNGSYRTSAAFLAFVTEKYDKELVRKLNKAMREGEYKEDIWRALTKKSVQELDEEWRASIDPSKSIRIDLRVQAGKKSQSVQAELVALGAEPKMRAVVENQAGTPIKVAWTLTNSTQGELKNVVVHFFTVKEENLGQKTIPKLTKDVTAESALSVDFSPGEKARGGLTFTIDRPGFYLLRLETIGAPDGQECFAAMDMVIK
jgi:hypothetical protein